VEGDESRSFGVRIAGVLCLALCCATAAEDAGKAWWSHIAFLADDRLEGRKAGTPGYDEAARYVASQFDAAKLKPAGTKGYFQSAPLEFRQIVEERSRLELIGGDTAELLELGKAAYLTTRGESDRSVEGDAVFVGYGLKAPEAGIDELAGLDLKGKIAVYLRGAPKSLPGALSAHVQSTAEHWRPLREAGAIGTASLFNTNTSDIPWTRAAGARGGAQPSLRVPELVDTHGQQVGIVIGPEGADRFLAGTGHTFSELLALDKAGKPLPRFPLRVRVRATPSFTVRETMSDNVIGVMPGSDPKLRNEYVVFSAHLDHLGKGTPVKGDAIYNGAMDNGSGIATLIEVAKALSGRKLRRSVVFAAVTSEEGGLLGSKYFAWSPSVKGTIVANVNTDMYLPIIPLKGISVMGLEESELGAEFAAVSQKFGVPAERDPEPERRSFTRSDQYSFIRRGIPALAFRFHAAPGTPEGVVLRQWRSERYHAPSDDLQQPVNIEGAVQFNRIMTAFLERIANREKRPEWKAESFFRRFATTD
jgi:hypothetical protein